MDPERQAVASALSSSLSGGDRTLHRQLVACLQSARCQKTTATCIGKKGPCDEVVARRSARRLCRPLRMELLEEARRGVCEPYVERMRPALMQQERGDAAAVQLRVDGLINDCAAARVDKDPRYWECFNAALREDLVGCALRSCRDAAAACAAKQCALQPVAQGAASSPP